MLLKRLLSSLILIPAVLFLIYFTSSIWLILAVLIVELLAAYEFIEMTANKKAKVDPNIIYFCLLLMSASLIFPEFWFFSGAFTIVVLCILIYEMFKNKKVEIIVESFGINLLCVIYIGWLLNHIVLLRNLEVHLVLLVLLITWFNDIAAYFAGKSFGKNKLAPAISPKKTWEGSIAGMIAGIIVSVIVNHYLLKPFSFFQIITGAFIIGVSGQIGDLVESVIKRNCGVKDSGTLIPGHGGLLDRIDSLIFTFPAAYYYFKLMEFF